MAETGYLILVDITGYTLYLSKSELDHAQEILQSLINSLLDHLHPPIVVSKLEGDAIFAYTLKDCFLQGQTLLEALEHLYFAFAYELEHSDRNTTCNCNACANMHNLDLKMVIHYGEFMLQKLGPMTELIGNDVTLAHRLLKNHIIEQTGIQAYGFFSQAAADTMLLGELVTKMTPHTEAYEHLGEVSGYVYDFKPLWQRERERRRVFVTPEEAEVIAEFTLPVSPPLAWDYLNEPETRAHYLHSETSRTSDLQNGRIDVGSTYHCAHGDLHIEHEIIDWKPFEYLTFNQHLPLPSDVRVSQRFTIRLEPAGDETNVTILVGKPQAPSEDSEATAAVETFWKSEKEPTRKKLSEDIPALLKSSIAEDRTSGRIKMRTVTAEA